MKRICFAMVAVMFVVGVAGAASAETTPAKKDAKIKASSVGMEVHEEGQSGPVDIDMEGGNHDLPSQQCLNAQTDYFFVLMNDFSDSYFDDSYGGSNQNVTSYDNCDFDCFLRGQLLYNVCAACKGWPWSQGPDVCAMAFGFKPANIIKKNRPDANAMKEMMPKQKSADFIARVKEIDIGGWLTEEQLNEIPLFKIADCNTAKAYYNSLPDNEMASCNYDNCNCNELKKGRAMYNVCKLCSGWPTDWPAENNVCLRVWGMITGTMIKPVKKLSTGQ